MHVIAEKRKWAFTICDKLISGVLLGNFVLIAPSLLIGFFSNYLDGLFRIYTLLSLFALILFLFYVFRRKKWNPFPNVRLFSLGFKVYVLPILLFALLVLFLHTFYLEYDAISIYLPYAKSIALTGSMKFNFYDQSTLSTGMPPIIPLIYAWAFTITGNLNTIGIQNDFRVHDLFRPIPAAYFILTALVVYMISREILQKKHAFLAVVIFVSFPSTILTLSAFTHYLDLSFVFYLVSSILCLVKSLKTQKPIWFLFTGVVSSLLLLAKELSVFIIPLIFSTYFLFSSFKYRKAVFVMLATSPFYLMFVWDMHSFSTSGVGWVLMRQLPVIALSGILYYLSNAFETSDNLLKWKNIVLLLVPFVPSAVFFLRGVGVLGSIYSIWGPAFRFPADLLSTATETAQAEIDVTRFFRWDVPFLSLGLGFSYLIVFLFSIVYALRRRRAFAHQRGKPVDLFLLMMLFTLLETMAFTVVGSQVEARRMYYFGPVFSIFVAYGLMLFEHLLKSEYFIYLCMFFNSIAMSYIWVYRFPFQTILELSYLKTSLGLANVLDLVFISIAFMGVFLILPIAQKKLRFKGLTDLRFGIKMRKRVPATPLELKDFKTKDKATLEVRTYGQRRERASFIEQRKRRSQKHWNPRVRYHSRRKIVYGTLLALSCSLAVFPTIPIWLQGADRNFDFFSFQYDVYEPVWENGILIVGYYYTDNVNDPYVTVSFGGSALRYIANRSVINLAYVRGVQSMQDMLTIESTEELLRTLSNSNIRYFLIPRSNNSFYNLYMGFRENFLLFRFVEQGEHFSLIHEFTYYQLFKFEYAA